MWNCAECGCQAILPGVPFCPQCYTLKEEAMPRSVAGAVPSAENTLPGEPGYVEPEKDEPAAVPVPDPGDVTAESEAVTAEEAEQDPAPAEDKGGK